MLHFHGTARSFAGAGKVLPAEQRQVLLFSDGSYWLLFAVIELIDCRLQMYLYARLMHTDVAYTWLFLQNIAHIRIF